MKTTTPKSSPESIVPAVHLEFIQNHLQNPTASGLESVEQYQILLDGFEAGRSRVLEVILNEFQMNCRHDALGTRLWRSGFHNKLDSLPFGETSCFAGGLLQLDSSGTGPTPEQIVRTVSPHPDPLPQGEGTARTAR